MLDLQRLSAVALLLSCSSIPAAGCSCGDDTIGGAGGAGASASGGGGQANSGGNAQGGADQGGTGQGGTGQGGACPTCPVCSDIEGAIVSELQLPGLIYDMDVSGTRLYVVDSDIGVATDVIIVDLEADGSFTQRGTIVTPGNASDVVVSGNHAYIADSAQGLQIADVTDPDAPVIVGALTFADAYGIDVAGGYAYVTGGPNALRVIDVSNPSSPMLRGVWGGAVGPFVAISVDAGVAYVADYTGTHEVYALDVTNPAAPSLLSTMPDPPNAFFVRAEAGMLYTANGYQVDLYDVSNPAAPTHLSTIDRQGDGPHSVWRDGSELIIGQSYRGIDWVDATSPSAPVATGTDRTHGAYTTVAKVGDFVVGGTVSNGLRSFDPAKAKASTFPTASAALSDDISYAMATDGRYAYIARGYEGLAVFDLGLATPTQIASVPIPQGNGVDVAVLAGRVYVAGGLGGLAVFDVSDPSQPALLSQTAVTGSAIEVAVEGDTVFVSNNQATGGGIDVVDVTDPSSPAIVAHIDRPFDADEMVVADGYLYLEEGGLVVYDVSDPTLPVLAADVPITSEFSLDLAVQGNLAAVLSRRTALEAGRLHLFDISAPASPIELGAVDLFADTTSITLAGTYAYVGENIDIWLSPTLRIVDISDPAAPKIVQSLDAPAPISDMVVIGPDLYSLIDAGAGEDALTVRRLCGP
ncbi:MAG: hypothetical protein U0271_45425 [Polyangiaceae bacterium]